MPEERHRLVELRADQAEQCQAGRSHFDRRLEAGAVPLLAGAAQLRLEDPAGAHPELEAGGLHALRALRAKYHQDQEKFRRANFELTKEYKRVAQSYRELQLRFRNVAYTDFNAFREVWNLNEKRLHERVTKLLDALRVVYEQQLGRPVPEIDPEQLRRWVLTSEEFEDLARTPQVAAPKIEEPGPTMFVSEALEHLRRMLTDEAGFIVEERVRGLTGDAEQVKLGALLKELGITRDEDVARFLEYFIKPTEFGELEAPEFVAPHELLAGLRGFVENFSPQRQRNQQTLFSQITADATQNTSSEVARAVIELQTRLKKQLPAQRAFWTAKSKVITPRVLRVLQQCSRGLVWYLGEVQTRGKLIEARDRLSQQNAELERLLTRYLDSEGSAGLIYAPGETVDFYPE